MRMDFQGYRGFAEASYTCLGCGKKRRKGICETHTVNPFNRDEDGFPKQATRVQADARQAAKDSMARFLRHPLCTKCEPRPLSPEGKNVRAIRYAAPAEQTA